MWKSRTDLVFFVVSVFGISSFFHLLQSIHIQISWMLLFHCTGSWKTLNCVLHFILFCSIFYLWGMNIPRLVLKHSSWFMDFFFFLFSRRLDLWFTIFIGFDNIVKIHKFLVVIFIGSWHLLFEFYKVLIFL